MSIFVAMVDQLIQTNARTTQQQLLTVQLLQPLMEEQRPQRVLVLKHASAADVVFHASETAEIVTLSTDDRADGAAVYARITALPFEDMTFDLVVLQHLVSDGTERVMLEAMRVLAPGGHILISGLNYSGMRYHSANRTQSKRSNRYPGLRINRTMHQLRTHSFIIKESLHSGFFGLAWPKPRASWMGITPPFFDRFAVLARHRSGGENIKLASFQKARSVGVTSAALDGISTRKSAL